MAFCGSEHSLVDMEGYWSDGFGPPPEGQGLNTFVDAIELMSETNLCVGGAFTEAGGIPVNCIAEWNGNSWEALAGGMNANVRALAVSGATLYAGGYFTEAGGVPANYIARWDGDSWSPLGTGMVGLAVYAIEAYGSGIYAGGGFDRAGGVYVYNIARWSEGAWHGLGGGTSDWVRTIAMSGSDLYAGGDFSMAGGVPVNRIARWDGSSWSPLGSGMNHYVYSIEVNGSDVYAGGEFTTAGGVPASRMARWNTNTSSWAGLGSGLNLQVCAIQAFGQDILAGGWFTNAGGTPSHYFARWTEEEVGTGEVETEPIPQGLRILSISPNPSTAAVQIALQSPGTPELSLDVCDISGHIVFSRELGSLSTGQHDLHWNGCDSTGAPLFPGVYFARVSGGGLTASARVMLVR